MPERSFSIVPFQAEDEKGLQQIFVEGHQEIGAESGSEFLLRRHQSYAAGIVRSDLAHIGDLFEAFFVAKGEGSVLGGVGLMRLGPSCWELRCLCVAKSARRAGVARSLCQALEEHVARSEKQHAWNPQTPTLQLTVLGHMSAARALYDSLGFVEQRLETKILDVDGLSGEILVHHMSKELPVASKSGAILAR
eukprot:TRINITY_DN12461_c1_g1_i2.p1 TRINITY_DN12461_c1_g1~~TRINITY_DN12461_c1_g1_i2.p1  ORF type:complete len:193 (+),score=45.00 TRINITY_DN12461_c1_g1_i2:34-612(+)